MLVKRIFVISLFLMLLIIFPAVAQDEPFVNSSVIGLPLPERVPITVENADQVVELARIGSGMIAEIAWTPDNALIILASSLGVWVYDSGTPEEHAVLIPVDTPVTSVAISDSMIAGGDEAGNVHLWDRATFEPLDTLTNHLYAVRALAFNDNGTLLASADQSGVARLWDVNVMAEQAVVSLSGAYFDAILFDGEGRIYLQDAPPAERPPVYFDDFYNVLWQIEPNTIEPLSDPFLPFPIVPEPVLWRGSAVFTLNPTGQSETILGVAFERPPALAQLDSNFLTILSEPHSTSGDRILDRLQLTDGMSEIHAVRSDLATDLGLTLSVNLDWLARGGNSSRIEITESLRDTGAAPIYLFGHTRGVPSVTLSPTDPNLLVSGSLDTTLRLWDVTAPPDTPSLTVLEGHQSGVTSVSVNNEGDLIVSASYDGTVRLWGIPRS